MIEMFLVGNGRERGLSQGKRYAELIRERIGRFAQRNGDENEIARRLWAQFCDTLPDYAEEVTGLADGAGADKIDVFTLTADEIFHGQSSWFQACTNVASTRGEPQVAKNSDGDARVERYLCVMHVDPADGLRSVRAAWLGGIGVSIGVNEAGVAYAGASLPAANPPNRGIPVMAIVANALDHASSADEAIELARQFEVTGHGFQAMWVDTTGAVRRNETLPGSALTEACREDWVVHTNWPRIPDSIPFTSATDGFRRNSQERVEVARNWRGGLGSAELIELLRTHGRGGLCQHGNEELYTVFGAIAFAEQRALMMSSGPPCAHPFARYELNAEAYSDGPVP
jgi:hypothetical protein